MTILERLGRINLPVFAPDDGTGSDVIDKDAEAGADGDKSGAEGQGDEGAKASDKAEKGADKSGTALDADLDDDGKVTTPADWPEDWKTRLADGDEEIAKLINRYQSPKAIAKAMLEREKLIRSGKVRRDMPDPEDEKAMAEWRKGEGIPDDPTGYVIPDTIKELVTDDDKPMLADFTEFAHSKNLSQSAMETAAEWYFSKQTAIAEEQTAKDKEAAEEAVESLRGTYGADFRPSMQLAQRFMDMTPEIGSEWKEARLPDGRRLGDIPQFVEFIVEQGKAAFGDTAFATADAEQKHVNRLEEINKIRDTDFDRYEREGLDKERHALLEKELKRKQR